MKKLFIILGIALICSASLQVLAQKGDMKLGPTVSYGFDIKELGVGAKFFYGITDPIRVAPSFNYWLVSGATSWEVNLDGNYLFGSGDNMAFYALAGLNYYSVSVDFGGGSVTASEIGLNAGAGMQLPLGSKLTGIVEAKYVVGNASQPVITGGVLFNL
jgi:outer membrane protein X